MIRNRLICPTLPYPLKGFDKGINPIPGVYFRIGADINYITFKDERW